MEQLAKVRSVERLLAATHVAGTALSGAVLSGAALAGERTLPVASAFHELLPDQGLRRGSTVACTGLASWSVGVALAAEAVAAGSWMAAVDLPAIGVEAAAELGVALDRLVRVDTRATSSWADVVAAAVDGFDLVLTRAPAGANAGVLRRLQTRVKHRSAVLVVIGATSASADLEVRVDRPVWQRVGGDAGHLTARRVSLEVGGRRLPRPRRTDLWLPGPDGRITAAPASRLAGTESVGAPAAHLRVG